MWRLPGRPHFVGVSNVVTSQMAHFVGGFPDILLMDWTVRSVTLPVLFLASLCSVSD